MAVTPSADLASWVNNSTASPLYERIYSSDYRMRNLGLGALGTCLNLLVLPIISTHDDLSLFLKAMFCCMVLGDLGAMATTLSSGFVALKLLKENLYQLTYSIYVCANINCTMMVAVAVERALAYRRPQLLQRLTKRKINVVILQLCLLATGCLLTLPVFLGGELDHRATTPLGIVCTLGIITEACIVIVSSLIVFVIYISLARVLVYRVAVSSRVAPVSDAGLSWSTRSTEGCGVQVTTGSNRSSGPSMQSISTSTTNSRQTLFHSRQLRRFRRATAHCAVLAVWFLVAYLPIGVYYMWVLMSGQNRLAEAKTTRITVFSSFPLANSLVNPVLIIWRLFRFEDLVNWLWRATYQPRVRLTWCCLHARLHCCRHWHRLVKNGSRREGAVADQAGSVSSSPTGSPEMKGTVLVTGPDCSTREIKVRETHSKRRPRIKVSIMNPVSLDLQSRRMPCISENTETGAANNSDG